MLELDKPSSIEKKIVAIEFATLVIAPHSEGGIGCDISFKRIFDDKTEDYFHFGYTPAGWNILLAEINGSTNLATLLYSKAIEVLSLNTSPGQVSIANELPETI